MENQVKEKVEITYAVKIVGNLACDNSLFDRTCPSCGGMYSSRKRSNCAKCGKLLTHITSRKGEPMTISEGTIYPDFNRYWTKRDADTLARTPNVLVPKYRFKIYSFMDEHNTLTPAAEHDRCRSGAKVEIVILNHQLIMKHFLSKDGTGNVELMLHIYTNRGDTIKVLTEAEYVDKVISHPVNPDGSPAPLTLDHLSDAEKMTFLQTELNKLKSNPNNPPQDVDHPPWHGEAQVAGASGDDTPNPFERIEWAI